MSKRVVTDGSTLTAKKQRVIDEEQKAADEKIEFSLEFTPKEERAWIHEERCNTIVLIVAIVMAFIVGIVAATIADVNGSNATSAVIDTVIVFIVAGLLKKISAPFVKMYVAKSYGKNVADSAEMDHLISGRSVSGAVFMYLVMALGVCIVALSMI